MFTITEYWGRHAFKSKQEKDVFNQTEINHKRKNIHIQKWTGKYTAVKETKNICTPS